MKIIALTIVMLFSRGVAGAGSETMGWSEFLQSWLLNSPDAMILETDRDLTGLADKSIESFFTPAFHLSTGSLFRWSGAQPERYTSTHGFQVRQQAPYGSDLSLAARNRMEIQRRDDDSLSFRQSPELTVDYSQPLVVTDAGIRGPEYAAQRASVERERTGNRSRIFELGVRAVEAYAAITDNRNERAYLDERVALERQRRNVMVQLHRTGDTNRLSVFEVEQRIRELELRLSESVHAAHELYVYLRKNNVIDRIPFDRFLALSIDPRLSTVEYEQRDKPASIELDRRHSELKAVRASNAADRAREAPRLTASVTYAPSYSEFAQTYRFAESWQDLELYAGWEAITVNLGVEYSFTPGTGRRRERQRRLELSRAFERRRSAERSASIESDTLAHRVELYDERIRLASERLDLAERTANFLRELLEHGDIAEMEVLEQELAVLRQRYELERLRTERWNSVTRKRLEQQTLDGTLYHEVRGSTPESYISRLPRYRETEIAGGR